MNWQQLCTDPVLCDLPYKIELNERGQIIMSPARLAHSAFQSLIDRKLAQLMPQGITLTECAIRTRKCTKVADVAWFSKSLWEQVKDEYDSPVAPEICIEVLSPGNTAKEMRDKKRLYFDSGAEEVWFCNENGKMNFYGKNGKLKNSALVPEFPKKI